jgi:hypothetical protein
MNSSNQHLINEKVLEEKLEALGPDVCERVQLVRYIASHYPDQKLNVNFIMNYVKKISDLEEFIGDLSETEQKISYSVWRAAQQAIKVAEIKPAPAESKKIAPTRSSPEKLILHMKYREFISSSYLPTLKQAQSQTPILPKKNSR